MTASFNNFQKLADALSGITADIVAKTAKDDARSNIQEQIKANRQIDTGYMFSSVYAVTKRESTYEADERALPQVTAPTSDQEAYVAVAANYGWIQNFGGRFIPARPFFDPGMEKTRKGFEQAIAGIEKKLKEASGS